ncbi:MAG: phage tail protein [Shewanella sp.]|nr:phage tail protein [Shewanella sp.]MCF1459472.1 phage tail protein [Shewanella sp.]
MSKLSSFVPSGNGSPGNISLLQLTEVQQASEGQKQFNLDVFRYRTDGQDLTVCVNGVMQAPAYYSEDSSSQVTLASGLKSGDEVSFHITRSKSADPDVSLAEQLEVKAFKPGMIIMWAGLESQIPAGWKLCNGVGATTNGIAIPNLLDRMVICAGQLFQTGTTGGSTTVQTSQDGEHQHTVNVEKNGNHSHTVSTLSPYYALAFIIKL